MNKAERAEAEEKRLQDYIKRLVDRAPPLTDYQKDKLSVIFGGVSRGVPSPYPTPEPRDVVTFLYRYFDGEGRLLYVGISSDVTKRERNHERKAEWWPLATRRETERKLAKAAETKAIKEENPVFNKAENPAWYAKGGAW